MQGLGKYLSEKTNCNNITTIQDINSQYTYEDTIVGGGSKEWELLSCGQDGLSNGYNKNRYVKR
jgi:hypothetical protein